SIPESPYARGGRARRRSCRSAGFIEAGRRAPAHVPGGNTGHFGADRRRRLDPGLPVHPRAVGPDRAGCAYIWPTSRRRALVPQSGGGMTSLENESTGRMDELTEALVRAGRYFRTGTVSGDLRTLTKIGGRQADSFYRDRWSHDKVVRSTHGVNCTGSCS